MSERLVVKKINQLDRYLRREGTPVALFLEFIAPEEGLAYRTSWKKEVMGRVIAFPLAVAALPGIAALAGAVKLQDGGLAFYVDERIGKSGKKIKVVKLRSLEVDANANQEANIANAMTPGVSYDPRATPLGETLRNPKVDETPQLVQVAVGRMALFEMRADTELSWKLMRERRQAEVIFNGKRRKSGDMLYDNAIAGNPTGLVNPHSAFGTRGTIDERYHYNAFFARKDTLGFDLYMGYRTLVKRWIRKQKRK